MSERNDLYREAKEKWIQGEFNDATKLFKVYLGLYPDSPDIYMIYGFLGKLAYDVKNFKKSIDYCEKALDVKPDFELASLGKYLSLVEIQEDAKAIAEMERFLSNYSANLYKDTLKELLYDLTNGYATNFEATIRKLANENGVTLNLDNDEPPSAS